MTRLVSVIIPTYNYGRFIAEAIESVLNQTLRASEIIVVDDGSTDNTKDVVQAFGNRVMYVRQERSGVCGARNRGVELSSGKLLAFLDADDSMERSNLEKRIAKFTGDKQVGLVHCGLREFDSVTGETIRLHLNGGEEGVELNLLLWQGNVIPGPGAVMVDRKAFDEVGGFDTDLKVGEDWDFCYRVARKYKVRFVPEPLINYRSHTNAAHRNVAEMERGMKRFYEKAFATSDNSLLRLRRRAYGNFHKVMAGSYFQSGNYPEFARHALRSVFMRPLNLKYFLQFPLRRLSSVRNDAATPYDSGE